MLIGHAAKRPSLAAVRRIKRVLRDALDLPEDATITVTQLACLEEDCAPLETVIGLLRPGLPSVQQTVHKATDDLGTNNSRRSAERWGSQCPTRTLTGPVRRHEWKPSPRSP